MAETIKLPVNYRDTHYSNRKLIREEYTKIQKGKCWYCGAQLSGSPHKDMASRSINKKLFPKGFFNYPIHLHHSHETGMTIGSVHNHCNAILWQYYGE